MGFNQLDQFSAFLNKKLHENIFQTTEATALDSKVEAGKEEYKLAIEAGDVDSNGFPFITVVADGVWSKKSYKKNYNALFGDVS